MNKIKEIFEKIKEYIHYHLAMVYAYKHDKFVDEKLDYLMKNTKAIHLDEEYYFIIIETVNNECYAIWNCNYPYGWLSLMLFSGKDYEKCKEDFFLLSPECEEVYNKKMPSVKKMLEFRDWLKDNCKEWSPLTENI